MTEGVISLEYVESERERLLALMHRMGMAGRRLVEEASSKMQDDTIGEAEWLIEGKIALRTLAYGMAYDGAGRPKRMPTDEEQHITDETFRNFIRQARTAIRSGTLVIRQPWTMMPIHPYHVEWWLNQDEARQTVEEMSPHRDWVLRVADARAWVLSLGADLPGVLGESSMRMVAGKLVVKSPPGGTDPSGGTPQTQPAARQVRWKAAIVEHWPHIVRAHGADPNPRTVIRHIRTQDKSGDILSHDVADELKWRTESGAHKVVKLKTFRNALSELRAQGLLRH